MAVARGATETRRERGALPARLTWSHAIWGALFLAILAVYGLSSDVASELVVLLAVYALLAIGLYVPLILTDQASLAHGAYFGIGAYAFAAFSARHLVDPLLGVVVGMVVAATVAAVVALGTRRLSGYFLATGTLLVALAAQRLFIVADDVTGGPAGIGFPKVILGSSVPRSVALVAALVLVWLAAVTVSTLRSSDLGLALALMRRSRPAVDSIGLNTSRIRVIALAVGAGISALGGSVFALNSGFVVPDAFGLDTAFLLLFIPVLGGVGSAWGCVLGGGLVVLVLQLSPIFGPARLLLGLAALAFVLAFPRGLLGVLEAALGMATGWVDRRARSRPGAGSAAREPAHERREAMPLGQPAAGADGSESPLAVGNIRKRYGGVVALNGVSFQLAPHEILGIVGHNGAGKTTLVDIITGVQEADAGQVHLRGRLLARGAARRAIAGLARTFQHPQLAEELTVGENVRLGLLRLQVDESWPSLIGWFFGSMVRPRTIPEQAIADMGDRTLDVVDRDVDRPIGDVSYGSEKLTEVGRALAAAPAVLLLDEPFAGLDRLEIDHVVDALQRARQTTSGIVLIDHNVDLMRRVCDRLVALEHGEVIATGRPEEVLQRPEVRAMYFGRPTG